MAAGAVALLAGVGVSWRRRSTESAAADAWWSQRFQRLDGAEPLIANTMLGRPLLLNFWAPWCVPCVAELPLLDTFARAHAATGWQVLALAIDAEAPVRTFVAEHHVELQVALAGAGGLMLARTLGNQVGGLPFSVLFDANGAVRDTRIGSLDDALLRHWLGAVA